MGAREKTLTRVKILVANLGSTSLKWRLFDFSNGAETMLHKGGFERVTDYAKAVEDCLGTLRDAGHIRSEKDLAAVGFKTIAAKNTPGCVLLDEHVLKAMEIYNWNRARAQSALHHRHKVVCENHAERAVGRAV